MNSTSYTTTIAIMLSVTGLIAGVLVTVGALSGDEMGRVNLLFFLFLFAILPIAGLLFSFILLLLNKNGIASIIISLPFWPNQLGSASLQQNLLGSKKNWLFLQSQLVVLAFAFGGLLAFWALLLGTDVNFVWRSTLLTADNLLPILRVVAAPWLFWNEAQPSLELLELSQNSRIEASSNAYSANWWRFAIAAQLTYNLIPRVTLALIAAWRYREDKVANSVGNLVHAIGSKTTTQEAPQAPLANLAYTTPHIYHLLDWANIPPHCLSFVTKSFGAAKYKSPLSALTPPEGLKLDAGEDAAVVVVKSWEPPLAELKDILLALPSGQTNYLLPLDWNDESILTIKSEHLVEWRRFAATLDNWQVLQPGAHS